MTTVNLLALELFATDSDGVRRRMMLSDDDTATIAVLLGRIWDGSVENVPYNTVAEKAVKVDPGIPMNVVAPLVGGFLAEVASGKSGDHMGVRNGIAFREDDRYYYVYQTATQIVVSQ